MLLFFFRYRGTRQWSPWWWWLLISDGWGDKMPQCAYHRTMTITAVKRAPADNVVTGMALRQAVREHGRNEYRFVGALGRPFLVGGRALGGRGGTMDFRLILLYNKFRPRHVTSYILLIIRGWKCSLVGKKKSSTFWITYDTPPPAPH